MSNVSLLHRHLRGLGQGGRARGDLGWGLAGKNVLPAEEEAGLMSIIISIHPIYRANCRNTV